MRKPSEIKLGWTKGSGLVSRFRGSRVFQATLDDHCLSGQKISRRNKISLSLSISARSFISYITLVRVKYCLFSEYFNLFMLLEPFRHRAPKISCFFFFKMKKGVRKCFVTSTPLQSQVHSFFSTHFLFIILAPFFLFVIKNIYIGKWVVNFCPVIKGSSRYWLSSSNYLYLIQSTEQYIVKYIACTCS